MEKFRIVVIETTNGKGETKTSYKIQKKFLFWFFDYNIITHYYTNTNWNAINEPTHMVFLTKRIFIFNTITKATEYLNKIQNSFIEQYDGDKIIRVFDDYNWTDTYINKSYWSIEIDRLGISIGYEYSNNLSSLKEMIDVRKTKTKINVVI